MTDPASRDAGRGPRVHPIEILTVRATDTHYVRFLGPLRQLGTHWQGKNKPPLVCWEVKQGGCPHHKLPYRSKWYAPALVYIYSERVWRRFVIEATEPLERQLRGKNLRGQEWIIRKVKPDPLAKYVQLDGALVAEIGEANLPEEFKVDPIIERVFGVLKLPPPLPNLLAERPFGADEDLPPPASLATQMVKEEEANRPLTPEEIREMTGRARAGWRGSAKPADRPAPRDPAPKPSTNGVNGAH